MYVSMGFPKPANGVIFSHFNPYFCSLKLNPTSQNLVLAFMGRKIKWSSSRGLGGFYGWCEWVKEDKSSWDTKSEKASEMSEKTLATTSFYSIDYMSDSLNQPYTISDESLRCSSGIGGLNNWALTGRVGLCLSWAELSRNPTLYTENKGAGTLGGSHYSA